MTDIAGSTLLATALIAFSAFSIGKTPIPNAADGILWQITRHISHSLLQLLILSLLT